MSFMLRHDDGQCASELEQADVVLVGVSRTSKTPTSIYLANRGVKVANVPVVPDCPLPSELDTLSGPLVVVSTAVMGYGRVVRPWRGRFDGCDGRRPGCAALARPYRRL